MYRDNEVGRVAAVREAVAAGDRARAVATALELMLAPPERPMKPDEAAREVWQLLADAKATPGAVDAALTAIRDGRKLRPHAYIDVVESVAAPEVHAELLDLAIARGWPAVPYLAAPCFALADAGREDALWARIVHHSLALSQALDRWMLVATILTITTVGRRDDLDRWFANWAVRRPPMWVVSNWLCTRIQDGQSTIDFAGEARILFEVGTHDATRALPLAALLVDDLRNVNLTAFFADYEDRAALDWPFRDHPVIAYLNASKHRRAITDTDLDTRPSALGPTDAGRHRQLVDLLHAPQPLIAQVAMVAPLFPLLHQAPLRTPVAIGTYRLMKALPPNPIRPIALAAWDTLARERLSRWQRFVAQYF